MEISIARIRDGAGLGLELGSSSKHLRCFTAPQVLLYWEQGHLSVIILNISQKHFIFSARSKKQEWLGDSKMAGGSGRTEQKGYSWRGECEKSMLV